jgi:hypothetical protein
MVRDSANPSCQSPILTVTVVIPFNASRDVSPSSDESLIEFVNVLMRSNAPDNVTIFSRFSL